jgi:hypothetical protein
MNRLFADPRVARDLGQGAPSDDWNEQD